MKVPRRPFDQRTLQLTPMKLVNSRKAVSTIIATILTINIAVLTGVIVFAWGQGVIGSFTAQSGRYFETQGDTMREKILLVNLRYVASSYYQLNITVRNVGYIEARVTEIYLNDTAVLPQMISGALNKAWRNDGTIVQAKAGKYVIPVGDAVTFGFASITWPTQPKTGCPLRAVVATDRGTRAYEEWGVTG